MKSKAGFFDDSIKNYTVKDLATEKALTISCLCLNYDSVLILYLRLYRWLRFKTINFSSSRPEVFCKKDVLKHFANFTRKHLCQSLFFNKVGGQKKSLFNPVGWNGLTVWSCLRFKRKQRLANILKNPPLILEFFKNPWKSEV